MTASGSTTKARRTRAKVSYRESSSESEGGYDSTKENIQTPPRAHSSRTNARTRARALEDPSDHVSKRRGKARVSYKELSSNDELDDDNDNTVDDEDIALPPPKRVKRSTPQAPRSRQVGGQLRALTRPLGQRPKRAPQAKVNVKNAVPTIPTDNKIPQWASLPYEVLLQIFTYASHPLHTESYQPTSSILWLVSMSRVCRAFADAALTALYRSPPLLALDKPHRLLELLARPAQSHFFNYQQRIQCLELDISKALAHSAPGRGLFRLGDLLPHLPRLNTITIINSFEEFGSAAPHFRWHYTNDIFDALRDTGQRLRSWTWNSSLLFKQQQDLSWISEIHQHPSFQSLKTLILLNFAAEAPRIEQRIEQSELLASVIQLLPGLKSLSFQHCPIMDDKFASLLPERLVTLEISNCNHLTSKPLDAFLLDRGAGLRELVLDHNQSLDLQFLTNLKRTCPHLESLHMDLNYTSRLVVKNASEPLYLALLDPSDIPTWPSTLQSIELIHLRKWTAGAAELLFESLLNAADELPYLRKLVLKAIIDIGWRDRAGFRERWIGILQKVFLRKSSPPSQHLRSLRTFREWKEAVVSRPNAVKLSHVQIDMRRRGSGNEGLITSARDLSLTKTGHREVRRLRPRNYHESSNDESDAPKEWKSAQERFIQGMCEVVDIRIDNLRPRDVLLTEQDFLDSEASGDEDWTGDQEEDESVVVLSRI
ncbi:hypothetical protein M501DRAFT_991400 [Patellaria atrata CBS 101060]|uniref:F-box domain-containing protein n=1 Tax=Patellaria atrata CBS 101060 TaxID=1346257 RepID=A0A9P4SCW6_9PEZI|nr:hypothetical protein M501DRAFT_991400 [Patellaria atrata CBS 101060]